MNPILAAGLLIGVLCGVWTFVMGFTGWYKDPAMASVFIAVVIPIEIGGLIWGLRKTAAQGRTYSGQVVAGTLMSAIAGFVISPLLGLPTIKQDAFSFGSLLVSLVGAIILLAIVNLFRRGRMR